MAISADAFVIGLTGPFGSGATTCAAILAERMQFHSVKLSAVIRSVFGDENPGVQPTRAQLQELGDELRESGSAGVLAEKTVAALQGDGTGYKHIVLDGIRNSGEIKFLREWFGHRFFLFALECPASERWERLKPQYEARGQTFEHFTADDTRTKRVSLDSKSSCVCI